MASHCSACSPTKYKAASLSTRRRTTRRNVDRGMHRPNALRCLRGAFHPHIHTANCVVCNGCSSRGHVLQEHHSATAPAQAPATSSASAAAQSRIELMQEGMAGWLALTTAADRHAAGIARVAVPSVLVLPPDDDVVLSAVRSAAESSNAFLHRLLTLPPGCCLGMEGIGKQLLHQQTLLDFQRALNTVSAGVSIRFFLVCGTALGARREGFFIPHDDDIDVGLFYEDLVALGKQVARDGHHPGEDASSHAATGVRCVLSRLATALPDASDGEGGVTAGAGGFLLFDVCGTVDKGLEVRMMHLSTGVRLDLNVYYSSPGESGVRGGEPFVWCATFYENAEKRAHGMYRYHHTPFHQCLETVPFCCLRGTGDPEASAAAVREHFLVPPEFYLEEYFGADWRTPKQYSYRDGLHGEYKNIIDE